MLTLRGERQLFWRCSILFLLGAWLFGSKEHLTAKVVADGPITGRAEVEEGSMPSCYELGSDLARNQRQELVEASEGSEGLCKLELRGLREGEVSGFTFSSFNASYQIHKPVLVHWLSQDKGPAAGDLLEDKYASLAAVHISNFLCMPRLALLWRMFRTYQKCTDTPIAVHELKDWSAPLLRAASPSATTDIPQFFYPPLTLRALAGWMVAPSLVMALQGLEVFRDHPWFVLYLAWLGLVRTAVEMWALHRAVSLRSMTPSEKLDSLVCSHVLPAAAHLILALLQAALLPFMPESMAFVVFYTRSLVLPLLGVAAVVVSWMPLDDSGWAGDEDPLAAVSHVLLGEPRGTEPRVPGGEGGQLMSNTSGEDGSGEGANLGDQDDDGGATVTVHHDITLDLATMEAIPGQGTDGLGLTEAQDAQLTALLERTLLRERTREASRKLRKAESSTGVHWPPPLQMPSELEAAEDLPDVFRCPITLGVMKEPAQCTSGITYERAAIMQWLERHRSDPVTHVPLRRRHISPNMSLRRMMEEWIQEKMSPGASFSGRSTI